MLFLEVIINLVLKFLIIIVPVLIAVAFLTLFERKIMGAFQKRKGPTMVGFLGLLQPFADGLKLFVKETVIPQSSNKFVFIFAPIFSFFLSILNWAVIPFSEGVVYFDMNLGIVYLLAISSLNVYSIIIAGWASNSRYSFLGGLRSAAQMISYEVSMGVILMSLIIAVGSLNLTEIVLFQEDIWFIFPFFPLFIMFFISIVAETNRPPFDLPEAEAELVAGYNVEYSSMGFALFFIGEYMNIILMSFLTVILFLGGWHMPFLGSSVFMFQLKNLFIIFLFIWLRVTFPRYRYDQLMRLGWKVFLPLSLGWVFFFSGILFGLDGLPFQV